MMKKYLTVIFLCFTVLVYGKNKKAANDTTKGYEIRVQLKPWKNQWLYLRYYFGSQYPVVDSAMLNEQGEALFKGKEKLPGGIYFIEYPDQLGVQDILIDSGQHFSLLVNMSNPDQALMNFTNSPDNNLLKEYEHFAALQAPNQQYAKQQLLYAANAIDAAFWQQQKDSIDKVIQDYRETIIQKSPGSFLSTLLIAMREPIVPDVLQKPINKADSAARQKYIAQHFWDGVNFWDGRLACTPFFDEKIDKFFDEITDQHADSVIIVASRMLGYAANNEVMSEFLLRKLLFGSMYHKFKWEDTVFIHLFENFIAAKKYKWLTDDERKIITERAYFLMGNIKGKPAPEIILPGIDDMNLSLLTLPAKYTLVAFWDPVCQHCRETLPRLDSIYNAKWKSAGVQIFSVAVESDGTKKDWLDFVSEHRLNDWVNVYNSYAVEKQLEDAGKTLPLKNYDVWYFPSFYLLDKDKRFMAKKLSYQQIYDLIESITAKK